MDAVETGDRVCPECGSPMLFFEWGLRNPLHPDAGRWVCSNYSGCELAPG